MKQQREQMPQVEIGSFDGDLTCPVCGDLYLHQNEVEIGWRVEDQDVHRHISRPSGVQTDVLPAKEFAGPGGYGYRRQYIVIRFSCEICRHVGIELEIYQKKGMTYLRWVNLGVETPDMDWEADAQAVAA